LLSSPGWPSFTSRAGTVVAAKNPIYQQQSFNGFLETLYEKFNNEHLEILEGFNDIETEQILINKIEQALINMGVVFDKNETFEQKIDRVVKA
ncbi:10259_t:CDS:2, partial [Cetraspora pellucida]